MKLFALWNSRHKIINDITKIQTSLRFSSYPSSATKDELANDFRKNLEKTESILSCGFSRRLPSSSNLIIPFQIYPSNHYTISTLNSKILAMSISLGHDHGCQYPVKGKDGHNFRKAPIRFTIRYAPFSTASRRSHLRLPDQLCSS